MNRQAAIAKLKSQTFDILVIGGGATGTGIALDAATRGLSVALVEASDFSAGTSSRSTKLIHGGVRYLEKAVLQMDRSQFRLVRDALKERTVLLRIAPHLARWLPIMTPLYNRFELPYYRTGLRMYDWLAGKALVHKSKFVSKMESLKRVPFLKRQNLRGAVIYYDGQFDDSRMNISLAKTAFEKGAATVNYLKVTKLVKSGGKISGATVEDKLGGGTWDIRAKSVINATGPFVDGIRQLDDAKAAPILNASSGTHVVLDASLPLPELGILIPKTEDKRVLFILPWLGHLLAGTTDNPAEIVDNPQPTEDDIDFIIRQVNQYTAKPVSRKNVRASWTGLRPLFSETNTKSTASISRDHQVSVSQSGLITIAGGKWTTYRLMAHDAVTEAIKVAVLNPIGPSLTEMTLLAGAEDFSPSIKGELEAKFGLEEDVAEHLTRAYGSRARRVAELASSGHGERISADHPFIDAEVIYAVDEECAQTIVDTFARRFRLAFLDTAAARRAVPKISKLMAGRLGWDAERCRREEAVALDYLPK